MTGPSLRDGLRSHKVALVTSGYFTSGGVQSVARWLKGRLLEEGYHVTVFDVDPSSKSTVSRRLVEPRSWLTSPKIIRHPTEDSVFTVGTSLAEIEVLRYIPQRRFTRELDKFDVVQVVCGGPALAFKAALSRTPVVVQMATRATWERQANLGHLKFLRRYYERTMTRLVSFMEVIALRRAKFVLVENAQVEEALNGLSLPGVVLAPPGIDVGRFSGSGSVGRSSGPLICLGRLGDHRKGLDRLIRAYSTAKSLDRSIPDLIICGRGSLTVSAASELASSSWASSIRIMSDVGQEELLKLLDTSSIFIQASYEEGLGVALLEGMACGLPAIATDTAGTRETVASGFNGILVPQTGFDGVALAKAIEVILSDFPRYSFNARESVEKKFSNEVTFKRFIDCYDAL